MLSTKHYFLLIFNSSFTTLSTGVGVGSSLNKRKIREVALQICYAMDMNGVVDDGLLKSFGRYSSMSKKSILFAFEKSSRVYSSRGSLDGIIGSVSLNYSLDRISKVDKNILRLLIYEIFEENLDVALAIVEGIHLCKKFSHEAAGKFIHSVIDGAQKRKA